MLYTNQLNFEHTAFLTEEITDLMLKQVGFETIEKQYCGHSIFYACKRLKVSLKKIAFEKNRTF